MNRRGFTLIELLIVVAIIAILALIAVPNFLEAQVRSKVSRVKSDLRTIATALESYCTDHAHYVPYGEKFTFWGNDAAILHPKWITTPVAYISSDSNFKDPFRSHVAETYWYSRYYQYTNFDDSRCSMSLRNSMHNIWGLWRMSSAGPDKYYWNRDMAGTTWYVRIYDPTNGTVSVGDIFRSQKEGDDVRLSTIIQYYSQN